MRIACRPKPSGSMLAVLEPRQGLVLDLVLGAMREALDLVLGAMREALESTRGTKATPDLPRIPLERKDRMPGVSLTRTVTSGSGARIGMEITLLNRLPVRGVQIRPRSGCPVAAVGAAPPGTAGRRSASGASRRAGTAAWASAWPEVCRVSKSGILFVKSRPAAKPGAEAEGFRSAAQRSRNPSSRSGRRSGDDQQSQLVDLPFARDKTL